MKRELNFVIVSIGVGSVLTREIGRDSVAVRGIPPKYPPEFLQFDVSRPDSGDVITDRTSHNRMHYSPPLRSSCTADFFADRKVIINDR